MDSWIRRSIWTLLVVLFEWSYCSEENFTNTSFYVTQGSLARRMETVYTLMKDRKTWNEAVQACRLTYGQYGGTLAKLTDPDMVDIIFSKISNVEKFWTGLYCTTVGCDTVQWSDCSTYRNDANQILIDKDGGSCYYVLKKNTSILVRDQCNNEINYLCQYTNPNSDKCDNRCNTSTGLQMCYQSGISVSLKPPNDISCNDQCAQTLGCWLFWERDQKNCLLGVSTCYTVNTSTQEVSVANDVKKTPLPCSTTSVIKESSYCLSSPSSILVSSGQSCVTTVTATDTVTIGITVTDTAVRMSDQPTTTVTATSVLSTTITIIGNVRETVTVQPTGCPDDSTLHSWLSSCSVASTIPLMTSFHIYSSQQVTPSLYVTTSSLGNHVPEATLTPSGTLSQIKSNNSQSGISGVTPAGISGVTPDEMVQSLTSSIVQELKVPTENLSKTKRLKISVYDGRTSSTVSGVSACIFLGMTAVCILAIDLTKLYGPVLRIIKKCKS